MAAELKKGKSSAGWTPIHHLPLDQQEQWLRRARKLANMPKDDFLSLLEMAEVPVRRQMLRMRFYFKRDEMLKYLFPNLFELPWNQYHRDVLAAQKLWWRYRAHKALKERHVTAAPRGIAKTTLGKGECVHDILYGIEDYIVIESADLQSGAMPIVKHIREMLEMSSVKELYGYVHTWNQDHKVHLRVNSSRTIQGLYARSFRQQIRGTNVEGQRPTKVVVDDGEHPKTVLSALHRAEQLTYLNDDVGKCGPPQGGLLIDWRGTILSNQAILVTLSKTPGWKYSHYKTIIEWPTRTDLWEQCRKIWADLDNKRAIEDARKFYENNKKAMHEGAVLLSPHSHKLYDMYLEIWGDGLASFYRERQNAILAKGLQTFEVDKMRRCEIVDRQLGPAIRRIDDGKEVYIDDLQLAAFLDPIPGKEMQLIDSKTGGSDYAAIAVCGKDTTGHVYCLHLWMRRCTQAAQFEALFELCQRYGVRRVGIESNSFATYFGRDFQRMLDEKREKGEYAQILTEEVHHAQNKLDRINRLALPLCANGWMSLRTGGVDPGLFDQFVQYPNSEHDDGMDALEGCYSMLGSARANFRESSVSPYSKEEVDNEWLKEMGFVL